MAAGGTPVTPISKDGVAFPAGTVADPLSVTIGGDTAGDATAANQLTQITAEQAILAKLSADPATQTTSAAILAKLIAAPATEATLEDIDVDIEAMSAKLPAALGAGGGLKVDGSGTALPVSGTVTANLGTIGTAATAANQATEIASLASIDTKVGSATPAGTNIVGKVGIDQTTPGTTNAVVATGNVASGATDSGNPQKIAGVFNTTPPTVTTGQRVDAQSDVNGNLRARIVGTIQAATDAFSNSAVSFVTQPNTSASSSILAIAPFDYNASGWDRHVKPNAVSRLLSSAATTNGTSVKASAGNVSHITGNNTVASKRYLKLYNKASAPTVGTDVPVITEVILASAAFDFEYDTQYFSTGIAYAITALAADNDTTAIGAGDIECLNVKYS